VLLSRELCTIRYFIQLLLPNACHAVADFFGVRLGFASAGVCFGFASAGDRFGFASAGDRFGFASAGVGCPSAPAPFNCDFLAAAFARCAAFRLRAARSAVCLLLAMGLS
jgi:hypothetical protein